MIIYFTKTGKDPLNVFRYIASALFGTQAFSGGVPMALLGILLHYIIAFGWTYLFFLIAKRQSALTRNWILTGILYGIFVWIAMNAVIVPLSRLPENVWPDWFNILKGASVLIFCIGLPVAFSASQEYSKPK